MRDVKRAILSRIGIAMLAGTLATMAGGCNSVGQTQSTAAQTVGMPGAGQQVFASDEEAAKAVVDAVKADDHAALRRIFGPAGQELVSGDRVEDRSDRQEFAQQAAEQTRLERKDDRTTILHVGKQDWPSPIPIVKTSDGKWFLDTEAGKQEILARRIGTNELETIQVCRAYVEAQREYASKDRDGNEVLNYAQRLASTPGHKDGLYWQAQPGEEQSPFGPLAAQASTEGYDFDQAGGLEPYHGYYFRILKGQGSAAPGGQYDYVINGNMIAGFALVACPARYGDSGVMTFIVSHQGKVYQKDLGPQTHQVVRSMRWYNPDSTWKLVQP